LFVAPVRPSHLFDSGGLEKNLPGLRPGKFFSRKFFGVAPLTFAASQTAFTASQTAFAASQTAFAAPQTPLRRRKGRCDAANIVCDAANGRGGIRKVLGTWVKTKILGRSTDPIDSFIFLIHFASRRSFSLVSLHFAFAS